MRLHCGGCQTLKEWNGVRRAGGCSMTCGLSRPLRGLSNSLDLPALQVAGASLGLLLHVWPAYFEMESIFHKIEHGQK